MLSQPAYVLLTYVKLALPTGDTMTIVMEAIMNRFPVLRFAVAAGFFVSLHAVVVTISAMLGVPGMRPFAELLTQFYGPYGYSISGTGIIVGALLGFSEGFVHLGIFGLIYKWLPLSR